MKLETYTIMTGIYHNRYSVVRKIGQDGYEHIKSFRLKKDAAAYADQLDEKQNHIPIHRATSKRLNNNH